METAVVTIPADRITSWDSFHEVFRTAFGFVKGPGRNMDAWIDCMSDLDEPDGLTLVSVEKGEMVAIRIDDAGDVQRRCPEQFRALIECTAFVNHRRVSNGEPPILALLLSGHF